MRRTIVVADRDEKLQAAFMTVFSRDHYNIVYASSGSEVERIAEKMNPDVYVVNVNLPRPNGIEVLKKLQKRGRLDKASFFFLKDETDTTELLGYQADGVIEKPINFFRLYETVTSDDEVIELTDLIEEKEEVAGVRLEEPKGSRVRSEKGPASFPEKPPSKEAGREESPREEIRLQQMIGTHLKRAMDIVSADTGPTSAGEGREEVPEAAGNRSALEQQFKAVLNQAMEEAADKLSARLAPVLTQYVEDYVKQMLLEITEKVIREEIEKLLKESAE